MKTAANVVIWSLGSTVAIQNVKLTSKVFSTHFMIMTGMILCIPLCYLAVERYIKEEAPAFIHSAGLHGLYELMAFLTSIYCNNDVFHNTVIIGGSITAIASYLEWKTSSPLDNVATSVSWMCMVIGSANFPNYLGTALFATSFVKNACILGNAVAKVERTKETLNCIQCLFWLSFRVCVLWEVGITLKSPFLLSYFAFEICLYTRSWFIPNKTIE